ncbi:MAG TPA: CBS domain-containing protein [Acetobacteraceae bacterium]|nr:CBS domain-containing protein [Acetobacteraceae bacterium]
MTVAAILKHKGHDIASVAPTARVSEIVKLLAERRIGAVLVRDAAGQMLGIVSERDIVRFLAREGAAVVDMTAAQLMTSTLHTATPATTVAQAMAQMTKQRVRHLPVLDDGELVGLVSIGDVVLSRLDQQAQEVDSLRAYVAGSM